MKKLIAKDVEFILEVDFDDMEIRGNVMASGNDAFDKKTEDKLIERLNNDDVWAWALVGVIAKWKGFEGSDYLGGCSYKDEEDFKKDGYYEDMKIQALEDLNNQIEDVDKKIAFLR